MSSDLTIRCRCGAVQGAVNEVSRRDSNRAVCYCDDCQAFAHFLGRAGDMLDPHGGTDVLQISPAHVDIAQGIGELRCMRLRPNGLYRWYTGCCRTAIGNTVPTRQVAFVGLPHVCIEGGEGRDAIDLAAGPVRARVWGKHAKGDTSRLDNLYRAVPLVMGLRVAGLLLKWRLRGDHKRSPYLDAETGAPISAPHVLTEAELAEVLDARDGVTP